MATLPRSTSERRAFHASDKLCCDLSSDRTDAESLKRISLFQEDHHSHRTQTASQEAPEPVATEGSVPVGSARLFIHLSSNIRTLVLSHRSLLPALALVSPGAHTLFSDALLIPPLYIYSAGHNRT